MSENHDPMMPDGDVNPINTDYKIGQDNIVMNLGPFGLDIHNRVFAISGLAVIAFVVLTLMFQTQVEPMFGSTARLADLQPRLVLPLAPATSLWWSVSGWRSRRWARCAWAAPRPRPTTPTLGWFSMLFAAGMGIGLMFYGVSEPLSHFGSSMGGTTMENGVRTDWAPLGAAAGDAVRRASAWPWPPPSSTGVCTPGRSTRSWRWAWPCSRSTRACR